MTKAYELKLEEIVNAYWKEYNAKEMKLRESETENQPHTFEELLEKHKEDEFGESPEHPKFTKFIKKGARNPISGKLKGINEKLKEYSASQSS